MFDLFNSALLVFINKTRMGIFNELCVLHLTFPARAPPPTLRLTARALPGLFLSPKGRDEFHRFPLQKGMTAWKVQERSRSRKRQVVGRGSASSLLWGSGEAATSGPSLLVQLWLLAQRQPPPSLGRQLPAVLAQPAHGYMGAHGCTQCGARAGLCSGQ